MSGFNHPALTRSQCFVILGGASVSLSIAMGMRQSFGLFLSPITKDLGMSAAEFTFAIAVQNLLWGFIQPAVGALADKYGTRWIGMSGAVFYAIGLSITAVAHSSFLILFGVGVMCGLALACSSTSITAKIAARAVRPERWSTAFGIVSAAGSVGSFFCALVAQSVIQSDGWRMGLFAFVGLALALGVVTAGLGALIPLLEFGEKKDSNCAALMSQARSDAGVKASDIAPRVRK